MLIGKLNDKLENLSYFITKRDSYEVPELNENGNPFFGENVAVSWKQLIGTGADFHFSFSGDFLINRIVLKLGSKSKLSRLSLYTENKEELLFVYQGETGKTIQSQEVALSVERKCNSFVLQIDADFSGIFIEDISVYGADLSGISLFPIPEKMEMGTEKVPVTAFGSMWAKGAEAEAALSVLGEKYREETGVELQLKEDGAICLLPDSDLEENAFLLTVGKDRILIRAADHRGFVMGVETLIKLEENGSFPIGQVQDRPMAKFRGFHLYLPGEEEMDFAKRLIKYIFSPNGYNHMIIEVAGAMEFESHPEINEAWVEANEKAAAGLWPPVPHGMVGGHRVVKKDSVRDLVAYARRFGIEVIPEIQSLGHVQFMTLAHPEIAERAAEEKKEEAVDTRFADALTPNFYAHSFCPSNPRSYEILFDLAEEIIEVFQPKKYVHMGHDEVYQIGLCPLCSQKNPADIFAEDVNRLHDYLAGKGLTMMIWADMLQPVSKYQTPAAIDRIPKDIVLLDFIWYFHMNKNIEEYLVDAGFQVAFGNLYSSHFPRYEKRVRRNILGGEISAWVETNEYCMQKEGKLYDFIFTGGMLWSDSYVSHCRYSYDAMIRKMIPRLRERVQGRLYPSLVLGAKETELLSRGEFHPQMPVGLDLKVNGAYQSLIFEHCTENFMVKEPWADLDVIGSYTVCYDDGETQEIPVTYGGNVSYYRRRQNEPFLQPYYRHTGYSGIWTSDGIESRLPDGEIATVYRYEWINPRKDAVIASVTYTPSPEFDAKLIVRRVAGIR